MYHQSSSQHTCKHKSPCISIGRGEEGRAMKPKAWPEPPLRPTTEETNDNFLSYNIGKLFCLYYKTYLDLLPGLHTAINKNAPGCKVDHPSHEPLLQTTCSPILSWTNTFRTIRIWMLYLAKCLCRRRLPRRFRASLSNLRENRGRDCYHRLTRVTIGRSLNWSFTRFVFVERSKSYTD
jgi:hypothetical protein